MSKTIYEVMDELRNRPDKVNVLRENASGLLKIILEGTFNPNIKWVTNTFPVRYIPNKIPAEMGMTSLEHDIRRIYLFIEGHPARPPMSPQKAEELLLTFLEALEHREAEVIINMFNKDLQVPGLTRELVKEVFPDLMV